MLPPEEIPEPWRSFLAEVDQSLSGEVIFHCIGGFVVTLLYGHARTTADDVAIFVLKSGITIVCLLQQ